MLYNFYTFLLLPPLICHTHRTSTLQSKHQTIQASCIDRGGLAIREILQEFIHIAQTIMFKEEKHHRHIQDSIFGIRSQYRTNRKKINSVVSNRKFKIIRRLIFVELIY